jgi:uncharacterized membrane protein YdjX (TVP38/TMEM64 family)
MDASSPRAAGAPVRAPARRGWWPLAAAAGLLLATTVAGRAVDVGRHLEAAQAWAATLGTLAPAAYVAVYVSATLVGVPGLPFTLLAPALFGVWLAFGVMVAGSALSAALAFLIARYLAREALIARLAGTDGLARLSRLVEEHDWIVIPFLRIVPVVPFAVVNYGFGLTAIGFWRYFGWSELAMIPMNALLVLGSGLFFDAATRGAATWPPLAAAVAAALAVIGLVVLGRKARGRE